MEDGIYFRKKITKLLKKANFLRSKKFNMTISAYTYCYPNSLNNNLYQKIYNYNEMLEYFISIEDYTTCHILKTKHEECKKILYENR
ncbi:hypothetical protein M0Q50_10405 [bacterium]|jgi:hypothetical protein|nr:hypothetical protein [bacterium]